MYRIIIATLLIQLSSVEVSSEDPYDDDPLSYLETHSSKYRPIKSLHDKDREIPDINYLRYSRSRSENLFPFVDDLESEYEDGNDDQFARPTRSQDKNDNFVRFGRGNSDFIRFGRNPFKYNRELRGNDQNFLRFGRSLPTSDDKKKRNKRNVEPQDKRGSDNFLRFGKGGDDSFIRYGRNQDNNKNNQEEIFPVPTASRPYSSKYYDFEALHYPMVISDRVLHRLPLLTILRKLEEARQNH